MGSVFPREKLRVESVPCKRLTRATGSAGDAVSVESRVGACFDWTNSARVSCPPANVAATARPEDFRNVRRLGGEMDLVIAITPRVAPSHLDSQKILYAAHSLGAQVDSRRTNFVLYS
jgi:hypothetical protein